MDFWIVVGVAAAGYITKYWQSISKNRDSLSQWPSKGSSIEKSESPSCPFRRFAQRKGSEKDVSADRRKLTDQIYADMPEQGSGSALELSSANESDGEKLGHLGNYADCNLLSISSLPSGFLSGENPEGNDFENGPSNDIGDNYHNPSTNEMDSFHGSARRKRSLRTKNQHFIKPLNSLESCLMAQLYQNHTKMEEYALNSFPSPLRPPVRPLLVTDRSQIINRASAEFHNRRTRMDDSRLHKEASLEKNECLLGIPLLPHIGSWNFPKKMKLKSGELQFQRLSTSSKLSDGSHYHSRDGLPDGKFLLCLGISVGVISSSIANRREVDNLKELLKQTENLVQDLQEELEMKDSLTVKELANENNESLARCDNSFTNSITNHFLVERNRDNFAKHDDQEFYDKEADESTESMSKIEAELEAELERMGLNMNSSSLQRRLSDFVELDPDFEADFARGELRADMISRQAVDPRESNQDASGTSTHHSGNYAVSPRELSLRLHEIIQSRLEERVKELETALENSQRKVRLLESEHKSSGKFSNTEFRYTSGEESKEEHNSMSEPLVMNLSGEALDAYNEAYEELMKINESEEEDSPSGVYQQNHQVGSHPFDRSISWAWDGRINELSPNIAHNGEEIANEFYTRERTASEDRSLRIQELLDVGLSADDDSDCDDEMEKKLIKKIVEKTKKGSPAVLNAQKWLFLMEEDEH